MTFTNPDRTQIIKLLRDTQRIAVVGLSPKPNRPSHGVAKAMQEFGYTIVPVRPAVSNVLGEKAYPDLYSIPGKIDLVDVFRAPEQIAPIVDACIELAIPALWLQDGVINEAQALRAQSAGIKVVMDRCLYRDYKQFILDPASAGE